MRLELISNNNGQAIVPTKFGDVEMTVFTANDGAEHVRLVFGDVTGQEDVLVRMHSACATGELFGSLKCDCGQQLERAMEAMQREGRGVLLYLDQEGRGIGLANKLRAYALQARGADTVDANRLLGLPDDTRDYQAAVGELKRLGVKSVRVLTNNPLKLAAIRDAGVPCKRVSHLVDVGPAAAAYVETKQARMGHMTEAGLPGLLAG